MIYLDHHAASPIDGEVHAAMERARASAWANPSSVHRAGRAARAVLERARETIAGALGAAPADVVLTGGGTEACNLGVLGLYPGEGAIVTTPFEHPAVAGAVEALARSGARVIHAAELGAFEAALEGASLAAVQWVNHETGTVFDVEAYARLCRARSIPLFVDATQALAKLPVGVGVGASALAFASSKIGGPPAAGALWIARDATLAPRALGGGQERGRRAGTPDAAAHAGFAAACELIPARLEAMARVGDERDRLERALVALGAVVNGAPPRVATVTNTSVPGWRGPSLVAALDLEGLCASSGAACSSGVDEPSPVVRAFHPSEPWRAASALRLSLGPSTRAADVAAAIAILERVIARKKNLE